jgi:diguanylate cyclase (GGDEF)-like protein/putative nucleotidyltransferase with HDIG domain
MASLGSAITVGALLEWHSADPLRFVCFFVVALLSAGFKVELPGIDGSMSVNFMFIIVGIFELSLPETLVMGCASAAVQCLWDVKSCPHPLKIVFNVFSMMPPAIAVSFYAYQWLGPVLGYSMPLLVVGTACTYFVSNTIPVAVVISLTEHKLFRKTWTECYFWSFPYYLVGAAIAGLVAALARFVGWQTSLIIVPAVYWIYRSYRLYLGRLEDEKRHVEEMASLHLRTIEALALAIEAKDHNTHDHLKRVRIYALEIAKDLGLSPSDMEAMKAAALLHDIGKLAVPEHIINKPGRLTPEEFEKMKIHPVVGAEILQRVNFPYPVVPIVRSHHERWDGTGYPDGLRGEEIPIGARILSAVDCLDALASDRQYRRALPLDAAMEKVKELAGQQFDPQVVEVLRRRYIELEEMARTQVEAELPAKLSTDFKVERGDQPAAGFERAPKSQTSSEHFLLSIAAARQEAQALFELSHDLGNSLSFDETLSVLSVRLKKLVPYDSVAIYVLRDRTLFPRYVYGDNFRLFSSLEIPLGQGLSGWVAQHHKPIVNGNPSVEPGYLNDETKFSTLRSALAVPLEGLAGVVGVLSLYKAERDAFTSDHLRILLAISAKVGLCVENALKYQQVENSAATDYLTGLPNPRALFLHLDAELARCKRTNTPLAVMVCDLDGFKQVNDRFGHLTGNQVLQTFAQSVKKFCREYDYVARMGGDEFVIVAPGLTHEAAEEKVATFESLARQVGAEICGIDFLSVSIGYCFYPEDGSAAEQLLSGADRKMYVIKEAHHQRTAAHSEPAPTAVPENSSQ